ALYTSSRLYLRLHSPPCTDERRGCKPIAPSLLLRPHHRLPSYGSIRTAPRSRCASLGIFRWSGSDRVLTSSACNRPQFCVQSIDTFQRRNRLGRPHLSAILRRIFTPAALAVPTDRSACSSAS